MSELHLIDELYIPMYAELTEILLARDGVTIEYLPPDEHGQELRTSASEDKYIDYVNEAESILAELGIFQESFNPKTYSYIARARDEYADSDLAIDDDAKVSESDEGVWVQAWVWLRNSEEAQA